jgi:hypothetical protein
MKIPIVKYRPKGLAGQLGFIEVDGRSIHKIEDLDAFYKEFGYTSDMAQAGILPDEFIWQKYIKGNETNSSSCLQIHTIEYLRKHSAAFREEYGEQSVAWIKAHATSTAKGDLCTACRMEPVCLQHRA